MTVGRAKPHLLTPEGLVRLTEELHQLRTEGREQLADRLHKALEDGQDDDFVDNAELEAARNAQAFLEGRIQDLEEILGNYQLIQDDDSPHDVVKIGDLVTIIEEGSDEEEQYLLVGAAEADTIRGRISNESPLGRALLGARKGSTVDVMAPNGKLRFRVKGIE